MSNNNHELYAVGIAVILLAACFTLTKQREDIKKQAVKHGFAEYVVDSDGETTWQWKEK
jgi:hypothetical protein